MTTALNRSTSKKFPEAFLADVLNGFAREQKAISPRWLYDDVGSTLFEQITDLPEYYVTRTEVSILQRVAADFAALIGEGACLVEYGAGAAVKVRIVLDALINPASYVAIDISFEHLNAALAGISADYPGLAVTPLKGDFLADSFDVKLPHQGTPVGFFPGSTIGNMSDVEIEKFLSGARALLGKDAHFILGADLRKDPEILIPAYDDSAKITAQFNLNLLKRINHELAGTIDVAQFAHRALWSDEKSRIEMHIESLSDQTFKVADRVFTLKQGETIHTENSRKFSLSDLEKLANANGWEILRSEIDEKKYFSVMLLKARVRTY